MGRKAQTCAALIDKSVIDGECWRWQGCKDKDGYGVTSIKGVKMPVHRAMLLLMYGPIPKDLYVLHTCKNRDCLSPYHLYVGTQKQNVQDQIDAGTFVYGSKNGKARLTEEEVIAIKSSNLSCRELADKHQYSYSGMWDILNERSWKQTK